ncbi:winged helix-turn-helix transcriptional regulator [Sedimentibacter hydroxybenzoicus DSM 7310]|uniref:Winged helix-turn-helix transcriptional regulator n=2 Tax=Sedimentibacter hydroxybenzoicus TaxID=29345 RepID=A0A974GVC4_SEDHY|nr:winged helix-turn-helix transcriptional regulator [Sedimentibacter hydroxybenzoicus DSM 7310]
MEGIGRYSAAVYRLGQSIFNSKLKDLDISSGQYDFFLVIAKNEGINQKELGEWLYVEKSTTAKAVRQLETKGYICKKQVKKDKRYSSLYLTEKGREAASVVESVFNEMLDVYSKDIPENVIEDNISVLKKVINNLQEEKSRYTMSDRLTEDC